MIRSALMNVMTKAAFKAGSLLKRDFFELEKLQISLKGPQEFFLISKKKASHVLKEELEKARPAFGIASEEFGTLAGKDHSNTWQISALEGSKNFLHGNGHFCVSIALERDKAIYAGLIYNPISNDLFIAEKGQGAYLNNTRLRVSSRRSLDEALIGFSIPGFSSLKSHKLFLSQMQKMMASTAFLCSSGCISLDLAYVAGGKLDGFWSLNHKSWQIASGIVIIQEAGGFIKSLDSSIDFLNKNDLCCGNDFIQSNISSLLNA